MKVPLHSKIKHLILGYYYSILRKVFKKLFSFNYVDLYAGDGECELRDKAIPARVIPLLPNDFKREWEPPFFSLLDYAKRTGFKLKCFFNDKKESNIQALDKKLESYKSDIKISFSKEDANISVKDAIGFINRPNVPSLFYLDPFNHVDLKFSTIKEISTFSDKNTGRKPELIINLMVYSMLQAIQRGRPQDFDTISESLGTDSWKKQLKDYKGITHILFKDIFIEQLKQLGYFCTWYSITSIRHNAPQYYLIFCTYDEKKIYSIHKNMEPNIKKLQKEKWVKELYKVDWMTRHIGNGQKPLSMFLEQVQ